MIQCQNYVYTCIVKHVDERNDVSRQICLCSDTQVIIYTVYTDMFIVVFLWNVHIW